MVKVTIISGFLGAGKTTLIKKLIAGAMQGEKVILLENEYGEVGIDGGFMRDAGVTVTELTSGCICCTLSGDFQKAIDDLIAAYHPDRLLIEPTGVGKLSDIRRMVEQAAARHGLTLTGCATVADAGRSRVYLKNFGEFYIDQLQNAPVVILSRTQLFDPERVEKCRALIAAQNPAARIITTPWDELDARVILEAIERPSPLLSPADGDEARHAHEHEHEHEHEHHEYERHEHEHHEHAHDEPCACGHAHHHHSHDADEVFDAFGAETARRFTADGLQAAMARLSDKEYGDVLRAKGIVQSEDGRWLHFDYVPGDARVQYGCADYTGRLCVIGTHLDIPALRALFEV